MKRNDIVNGFTLFLAILCLLTFTLNIYNGRFLLGDFKVYYSAAYNYFHGGPVYQVSFYTGSGNYKYSPATLFFFLPYLMFNFKTASIFHFFILGTAYWYAFIVFRNLILDYFLMGNVKHNLRLLSLAFVCILIHFARELYLGNINIILLMLGCLSIRSFLTEKHTQGGFLLGVVILTKPYLMILLLPLILRKKWKALTWVGLTITCGLLMPLIFPGPLKSIGLYRDWIKSIMMHGEDFPGMTSIDYFFRLVFPSWPSLGILWIFLSVGMLVILFILNNIRREKQEQKLTRIAPMDVVFEWFLLLAIVPNLIKTDWVLLLFTAPLLTFMVFFIASRKQYWWIPVLVVLLFFYGANSDDLLGRGLSHKILYSGIMGLSNFLLILASLIMYLHHRQRTV